MNHASVFFREQDTEELIFQINNCDQYLPLTGEKVIFGPSQYIVIDTIHEYYGNYYDTQGVNITVHLKELDN